MTADQKKTTVRLEGFEFDLIHTAADQVGLSVPEYLARAGKQAALRTQLLSYQGADASLGSYLEAADAATAELWTQDTK